MGGVVAAARATRRDPGRAGPRGRGGGRRAVAGAGPRTRSRSTPWCRRWRRTRRPAGRRGAGGRDHHGEGEGRRPGGDVDRVAAVRDALGPDGRHPGRRQRRVGRRRRGPGPIARLRPRSTSSWSSSRWPRSRTWPLRRRVARAHRRRRVRAQRRRRPPACAELARGRRPGASRSSPWGAWPPPWRWPRPPACRPWCRRCTRRRWAWPPGWPWPPPCPTCPTPAAWAPPRCLAADVVADPLRARGRAC